MGPTASCNPAQLTPSLFNPTIIPEGGSLLFNDAAFTINCFTSGFFTSATVLVLAAAIAGIIPAQRAASIDPVRALRIE